MAENEEKMIIELIQFPHRNVTFCDVTLMNLFSDLGRAKSKKVAAIRKPVGCHFEAILCFVSLRCRLLSLSFLTHLIFFTILFIFYLQGIYPSDDELQLRLVFLMDSISEKKIIFHGVNGEF